MYNFSQTLAGILYAEAERTGKVDGHDVQEILRISSQDACAETRTHSPPGANGVNGVNATTVQAPSGAIKPAATPSSGLYELNYR